jgi:Gluconate 2-dehydrogenase subunit 3
MRRGRSARLRLMSEHRGSSKIIPVVPVEPVGPVGHVGAADSPAPDGIRRREALQALLGTVGAGLALPSIAEAQHPMHQYPPSPATVQQAQQKAAVAAYTPEFLDAHQLKTLEVLAETIVPGSTTARVAPFLDQLLAVESAENQRAFLGALGAFDMAASTKHGKAWNAIAATEQDALLREASTADPKSAMRGHFQNLKGWIAGAYYSSEPGMRELGWTGAMIFAELPGCTHPGGHGV